MNMVGAGAAALAALHPLDFDPDDKLAFSVGVGHYRGASSGAIGMFYRPDEKTMFSIGGTVGNAENMFNFGLSVGLDRVDKRLPSRAVI
jgi:autotransporter adhesin